MNQEIGKLIDECKRLEPEIYRLLLTQLSFYPLWMIRKVIRISEKRVAELIEEGKKLGGSAEVEKKCNEALEEYNTILSELAGLLEEKEFKIGEFKGELREAQFRWLKLKRIEIKKHLKGIEII